MRRLVLEQSLPLDKNSERQPFWSSAIAVGDADWLATAARRSGMKQFEIREADDTAEDTNTTVKQFFLGSINQCKIP